MVGTDVDNLAAFLAKDRPADIPRAIMHTLTGSQRTASQRLAELDGASAKGLVSAIYRSRGNAALAAAMAARDESTAKSIRAALVEAATLDLEPVDQTIQVAGHAIKIEIYCGSTERAEVGSIDGERYYKALGWVNSAAESRALCALLTAKLLGRSNIRLAKLATFEPSKIDRTGHDGADLIITAKDGRTARAYVDGSEIAIYEVAGHTVDRMHPAVVDLARRAAAL